MINPRISAVWSTTKEIEPFSCTPRVQEVHTKAEAIHLTPGHLDLGYYLFVTHVHLTPGLLGLGVLCSSHA